MSHHTMSYALPHYCIFTLVVSLTVSAVASLTCIEHPKALHRAVVYVPELVFTERSYLPY
jgi:hypothetical protein